MEFRQSGEGGGMSAAVKYGAKFVRCVPKSTSLLNFATFCDLPCEFPICSSCGVIIQGYHLITFQFVGVAADLGSWKRACICGPTNNFSECCEDRSWKQFTS